MIVELVFMMFVILKIIISNQKIQMLNFSALICNKNKKNNFYNIVSTYIDCNLYDNNIQTMYTRIVYVYIFRIWFMTYK